jgi:hypothetical protein
LRAVVAHRADVVPMPAERRKPRWKARLAVSGALAAAAAVAAAMVLPAGSPGGAPPAFAVTENTDGEIVVDITDIRDAAGLERKLEEHGLKADVRYTPQNKVCVNREFWEARMGGRPKPHDAEDPMFHKLRGKVRLTEPQPGTIRFTIDRSDVPPEWGLVIQAQHDWAEHGQTDVLVPSVAAGFEKGNVDDCVMVDGSIEGWGFQVGAPPPSSDADKEADFAEYKERHPEGAPGV